METEDLSRPRHLPGLSQSSLPPIGSLRMERNIEGEPRQQPRYPSLSEASASASQLPSPSSTSQTGPTASYAYTSSTSMAPSSSTGYISPPESRRPTEDKIDSSGHRQSLPSIHEALSNNPLPYSATTQGSAPLVDQPPAPLSAPPIPSPAPRPFLGGPQGPPNPFAPPPTPATPREQQLPPPNTLPNHQQSEQRRSDSFSAVNGSDSRPRPIQTFGLPRSPRTATSATFVTSAGRSPILGSGFGSAATTSPTNHGGAFRSPYPHSAHSVHPPTNLQGPDDPGRPFASNWKLENPPHKYPAATPAHGHTETVKRHLDIYEAEMAFNDVLENSGRLHEFSRHFASRLHQTQRSELSVDALPNLAEVDEMIRSAQCIHAGLDRIRSSIVFQQAALADERQRAFQSKLYQDEMNGYPEDFKGNFTGGDAKKRRGKAAPPGRCHSCNRAETPEWRRGPDGARTLCNACGLHYAKLTRKNGANKAAAMSSSNLRPKNDVQ